jgi:hypothetical protein
MNSAYQDAVARDGLRSVTSAQAKKKIVKFYDEQLNGGQSDTPVITEKKPPHNKITILECGSCGETYVKNHWLHLMCPSCEIIGQTYLLQNHPRAKKPHFIKNIMILTMLISRDEHEQATMSQAEIKSWIEENYVPYVMMK